METLPNDASSDQTGNIPPGYYRRNTGMLHQLPKAATEPPQTQLTEAELDILLNDPDALRREIKSTLIVIMKTAPKNISLVNVCKELADRLDGKAPQSVSMTVRADNTSKLSDDQLAALLALLPDPVIIPPMPVITN